MELEYPKDNRGKYKYLEGWNIIKADGQLFRIPKLSKVQDNGLTIKVTANHIFYDLSNDLNEDISAENKTALESLQLAVTNFKYSLSADDLGINTLNFYRENPVASVFKILEKYNAELYRDNFNIGIKSRIGSDTGILISYGKNIRGFEQTLDYSTIATKIMPIGKDGLTIDLVNGGSKYLESPRISEYPFIITKVVEFKDIEDATELKNKALSLWGTIDLPSTNYKVNFVELSTKTEEYKHLKVLQEVKQGDTVTIRHKEFNVDISARVIKIKKNVLTYRLEEIELGQFKDNIITTLNKQMSTFNNLNQVVQDTRSQVFQNNERISLVVREDGTIDGDALASAINISSTKIEMSALNINLSGYVTFSNLSTSGQTSIHGGNIITNTISFNSLSDKPFIPTQYTDSEALQAWETSGYATYIDSTGAYIGNIKANQLLIGGANGSISFNNLVDKPFIPSSASDVGAIPSTYIDANGIFTRQVYANNINVANGKITATQIDVENLSTQITTVGKFISFSNSGSYVNGIGTMTGGAYAGYLGLVASLGIYLNAPIVKTTTGTVATQEWVNSLTGGGIYAKFK